MSTTEKQKVLEGIAAGDNLIITAFYKKNYDYIKGYILQNSGNNEDVEDIFQDALVIFYQKLKSGSLEINVSIQTYFYAICKNMWRSRLRKKRKLIVNDNFIKLNEKAEMPITTAIENNEREHIYHKYFITLSDTCKELLNLIFDGNSMKEISNITGYSEGYSRKKKFECKKSLLEKMEKDPKYQELKLTSEKE